MGNLCPDALTQAYKNINGLDMQMVANMQDEPTEVRYIDYTN